MTKKQTDSTIHREGLTIKMKLTDITRNYTRDILFFVINSVGIEFVGSLKNNFFFYIEI